MPVSSLTVPLTQDAPSPADPKQRGFWQIAALTSVLLAALASIFLLMQRNDLDDDQFLTSGPTAVQMQAPAIAPQMFEQLTPEAAEQKNAARPLDKRKLEAALPFVATSVAKTPLEWERAVNCLAMANYYEAIGEGVSGMRAVSQVVLNRVRHPAFPKSVCGVVFQGGDRSTGCQFTFVCDGSLGRTPVQALFQRARAVAEDALRGHVEASVGMATHYHTKQVVPYWASTLDKIQVLGAHIFYVWQGGAGNRSAFVGRYEGEMSAVADRFLPLYLKPSEPGQQLAVEVQEVKRTALFADATAGKRAASSNRTYLVADETPKSLKADNEGASLLQAPVSARLPGSGLAPNYGQDLARVHAKQ